LPLRPFLFHALLATLAQFGSFFHERAISLCSNALIRGALLKRRGAMRRGFEETSVIKGLAHGMPASLGLWYLIYLAIVFVLRW
jgi:hypothetical protein